MRKADFSKIITDWYLEHQRDLPWRNTPDPYKIWLSEIILQQTRVAQGLPYYQRFVQKFPNVNSLARAREQEVLRLWQGLGYYTRARNLHRCAIQIVKNHNGKFPGSFDELKALSGIGVYTAAAIASFAFHQRVAVVDGNVYRVLARLYGIEKDTASPEGKKHFDGLANELISKDAPGLHNQAIMEFGALQCVPKNPLCESCPFSSTCYAFRHGQVEMLPVKRKKTRAKKRYFDYWVIRRGNKVFMKQRTMNDIWKGLFDFPLQEQLRPLKKKYEKLPGLGQTESSIQTSREFKHVLTHQIIIARFHLVSWTGKTKLPTLPIFAKARWFTISQIKELPKPVLITRFLEEYGVL